MRLKLFSLIMGCAVLLTGFPYESVQAAENNVKWNYDYEAAVKEAKATGKPMLLLFTGSGWCPYCVKLDREIFSNPQFARSEGDKYVFVKLDFTSRGEAVNAQFKKQHSDLCNRYGVRAYPTVKILNSEEQVLMTTGYRAGGVEQYIAHLHQGAYARSR